MSFPTKLNFKSLMLGKPQQRAAEPCAQGVIMHQRWSEALLHTPETAWGAVWKPPTLLETSLSSADTSLVSWGFLWSWWEGKKKNQKKQTSPLPTICGNSGIMDTLLGFVQLGLELCLTACLQEISIFKIACQLPVLSRSYFCSDFRTKSDS